MVAANTWLNQQPHRQRRYREPRAGWTTFGRSWVMDFWLIERRWWNSVRTGLPSDQAPLMVELEGRFAVRRRGQHGRWKVDRGSVTEEQREAYNAQVRRMRQERPEAPELAIVVAARSVLRRWRLANRG